MRVINYKVSDDFSGKDGVALLKFLGCSKHIITRIKNNGGLTVNGKGFKTIDILKCGDEVRIVLEDSSIPLANSELSVPVVYDDEDVVVFDKPPFMPVHESLSHYNDTLANFFAAKYPDCSCRIINRLDRNTSGLCVVAKNILAASKLGACNGIMPEKTYYAVVSGDISDDGEIIVPIAKEGNEELKHVVSEDGKFAHTKYHVLMHCDRFTLLEIKLLTGRTHQIRVHFSYIGHALLGDEMYGGDMSLIDRQALHCGKISFLQPMTRQKIELNAELPLDMKRILNDL